MAQREKKICSVCKKEVLPPLQWWGRPYEACSDCIKKSFLEIRKEKKEKQNKELNTTIIDYRELK